MKNTNQKFLEEYKRCDKLCREVLGTEKGITSYIEAMQDSVGGIIPGWAEDLKTLKELRHKRNSLSHDVGTFDEDLCTEDDIAWLLKFRDRVTQDTDPLALLCQELEKEKNTGKKSEKKPKKETKEDPGEKLTAGDVAKLLLRLLVAGGVVWLLLKFVFRY